MLEAQRHLKPQEAVVGEGELHILLQERLGEEAAAAEVVVEEEGVRLHWEEVEVEVERPSRFACFSSLDTPVSMFDMAVGVEA